MFRSPILNNTSFEIGDIVWFDYMENIERIKPLKGRIKSIDGDYAEIVVNKHRIGKVRKDLNDIFASKEEYDIAKKLESERKQQEYYEETATVNGLLTFLDGREMICRGDADNDEWAVITRRIREAFEEKR